MRKRSDQHTFAQRLDAQKLRLEREFARLPSGQQRDLVAARIEQLRMAAEMYDLLSSREHA